MLWAPRLRSYRPAEASYDLVVVLYLHLLADERRAVHAAVVGGLRPGGVVLVVGHDVTNLANGYGGPQDPSILFTPDDVAAELAGLSIQRAERVERVERVVTTDDGERVHRRPRPSSAPPLSGPGRHPAVSHARGAAPGTY